MLEIIPSFLQWFHLSSLPHFPLSFLQLQVLLPSFLLSLLPFPRADLLSFLHLQPFLLLPFFLLKKERI